MKKHQPDHPLLDLTPDDLRPDSATKLSELEASGQVSRAEIDAELDYLRLMSSRKVQMPDDVYFALIRQRIHERVVIERVTIWKRIESWLLPQWLRPAPALVTIAAVLLVAAVAVFTYHGRIGKVETQVVYGPYMSIGDGYTEQVSKLEQGQVSPEDMQRYREILTMSMGILGSPSSLSRSQALLGAGRRL